MSLVYRTVLYTYAMLYIIVLFGSWYRRRVLR